MTCTTTPSTSGMWADSGPLHRDRRRRRPCSRACSAGFGSKKLSGRLCDYFQRNARRSARCSRPPRPSLKRRAFLTNVSAGRNDLPLSDQLSTQGLEISRNTCSGSSDPRCSRSCLTGTHGRAGAQRRKSRSGCPSRSHYQQDTTTVRQPGDGHPSRLSVIGFIRCDRSNPHPPRPSLARSFATSLFSFHGNLLQCGTFNSSSLRHSSRARPAGKRLLVRSTLREWPNYRD